MQLRWPGGDPPRAEPLPGWLRAVLAAQGVVGVGIGVALFVAPAAVAPVWPWLLTPLTARALAAWLVGMGVILAQSAWEGDWRRVRWMMGMLVAFGVLQLAALARFPGDLRAGSVGVAFWTSYVVSILLVGCYGVVAARSSARASLTPA